MTRVLYFRRATTTVDPETEIIAGTLLDGGGPLSADVTLDVNTTELDERIRDVIAAAVVAGTNVTVTVNDGADTITIASSGGLDAEGVRDTIAAALVAGTDIDIDVDDGGDTITINSTAAGGGGSTGAVPLPLDVVPTSPHSKDDEFTGSSLDAKWTSPLTSNSGNGVTNTVDKDWLIIEPAINAKRAFGIRQASPTGSFTVMAKIVSGNVSGSDLRPGLYVGAAGGRGHIVGPFKQDGQVAYIGVSTLSNTADWSGYDGTLTGLSGSSTTTTWVKINWNATTSTMTFYWSQDGVKWKTGTSRGSMAQPDQMGLVLYFNGGGGPSTGEWFACEWFRVTEP